MIANNILELIGKTPMLKLNKYMEKYAVSGNIIAKLECFNPMHSIKDRAALQMIEDAEKENLLNKNTTIIEATSGNTGIGFALVAVIKGYKLIITMPESMSKERIQVLRAFGAEVILTPAGEGMQGSITKAEELCKEIPNSYMPRQFANDSNPKAHIINTGKEILDDTKGKVDIFVAGVGTGGTITGVGTILKVHSPNVKVVAVEPSSSPIISQGRKGSHKIQGIGAGFIPQILTTNLIDEVFTVDDSDAISTTKELLTTEGIFVGISAGAAVYAAREIASRPENAGKNIVVILPDSGYRYMSSNVFT